MKDGGVLIVTGKLSGVVLMGGKWGRPSGFEGRVGKGKLQGSRSWKWERE